MKGANNRILWLIFVLFAGVGCQQGQKELKLRDEAVKAMVGLQALQYEDYRYWYYKIEKRSLINRNKEVEATLLLLKASEKLIYWREVEANSDSLLDLALSKSEDDSLRIAIKLRKVDYKILTHQFEAANHLLQSLGNEMPADLLSEKKYLQFRFDSRLNGVSEIEPVLDSLRLNSVNDALLLRFLTKAGDIHYNYGNFDQSAYCYKEALALAGKIGWKGYKSKLLVELADVAYALDELDSVVYYVDNANTILLQIPNPEIACNGYYIAARAQLQLGEVSLAQDNFLKLQESGNKTNNPRHKLKAWMGLSEIALSRSKVKLADSLIQYAIALIDSVNDDVLTHQAFFHASKVASSSGRYPEALIWLQKGEYLERVNKDSAELVSTLYEKLRLLLKVGRYRDMEPIFTELDMLLFKFPIPSLELSFLETKADWLAGLRKYKEANKVAQKLGQLISDFNKVDEFKIKKIKELQANLVIQSNIINKEKNDLSQSRKTLFILLSITLLVLSAILFIFFARITYLNKKNAKIKKKLEEFETQRALAESTYIQISKIKNEYLRRKIVELNLFDSWSEQPDRVGISVLRFNLILYYFLSEFLNVVADVLRFKPKSNSLENSITTFQPEKFKPEWEMSWDALRTFQPCQIKFSLEQGVFWSTDAEKVMLLIDILVRQFIVKSHDRKELCVQLFKEGFSLETSLLYEHELKQLSIVLNNFQSSPYTTSSGLQSSLSRIAISMLIVELGLRVESEQNMDTINIKFLFINK